MKKENANPAKAKRLAGLRALGRRVTAFEKLETFPKPEGLAHVRCVSDEVTALCPVTGQPDWYTVTVDYIPRKLCVESKTLKLYLQSFRNAGHFCEEFACIIAKQLQNALAPFNVTVTVAQKARGGVAINGTATLTLP